MGYHKGPALVALTVFDGRAVNMDAFDGLRAMVEYFASGQQRLYAPGFDDEELASWMDKISEMASTAAAKIRREASE